MKSIKGYTTEGNFVTRTGQSIAYSLHSKDAGPNNPAKSPRSIESVKPRITLIHSLAMTRDFWAPTVDLLVDHADILTFDVRGHGKSPLDGGAFTADDVAEDLSNLLMNMGWKNSAIAGASMGGCLGLAFAAKYPDKTSGLCLIDSTAWYGEEAPDRWSERAATASREGMIALADFQKTRWFSDQFRSTNPSLVEWTMSIFEKNDVNSFKETCKMMGEFDMREDLASLKMPVSIIVGEQDYATPLQMSEFLHQSIKGSTLNVIKGARHLTPLECPLIVSNHLINLLSRIQ